MKDQDMTAPPMTRPGTADLPDPLQDDIASLAAKLDQGEITSVSLTEATLTRIAALDPRFHAFVTLAADRALEQAKAADARRQSLRGTAAPALLGIPLGVKDMFDIKGLPVTAGMPSRANAIASRDAVVIEQLEAEGAVILGTLKLAEGVFGEYQPRALAPVNPWSADLWPGASSGGSAVAVATRLCAAALASDTGGSVRMPSAVNGQTGLKVGRARVSLEGAFPLAPSFDHAGVIAKTAADVGLTFRPLASPAPIELRKSTRQPKVLQIGLVGDWLRNCDSAVLAALDQATQTLADLGHRLVPVKLTAIEEIAADWYTVASVELAAVHDYSFSRHVESYGQALATAIRVGRGQDLEALSAARARLASFAADLRGAMSRVHLLALPVFPFTPPSWTAVDQMDEATILAIHRYTCPFSVSGLPTLTLPGGFTAEGHPLAVQLAGPLYSEELLIALGTAFQSVTDWHKRNPTALQGAV